jgi:hypothetical protein
MQTHARAPPLHARAPGGCASVDDCVRPWLQHIIADVEDVVRARLIADGGKITVSIPFPDRVERVDIVQEMWERLVLRPDMLEDTVIYSFLRCVEAALHGRVAMVDSFLLPQYKAHGYQGVAGWMKKVDALFDAEAIVFIIHEKVRAHAHACA